MDIFKKFLGPLDKSACVYFYFITLIAFVLWVFILLGSVIFIIRRYKQINSALIMSSLSLFLNVFLIYFVNRLLHTMCVKSLSNIV